MLKKKNSSFYFLKQDERFHKKSINLIASENYTDPSMLKLFLSNIKYAEGYNGKRYYKGCKIVDMIEEKCIENFKTIFDCKFANVQPHCGSNANLAVLIGLLDFGDTVLSLSLEQGAHLTHGFKSSVVAKMFKIVNYSLKYSHDELNWSIDLENVEHQLRIYKPKILICGFSAFMFKIDFKSLYDLTQKYNCILMADIAHIAGIAAVDKNNNPFPNADVVTLTTHKTLRGPRGGTILTNSEVLLNKINKALFPGIQGGSFYGNILGKLFCTELILCKLGCFKRYIDDVITNANIMLNGLKESKFFTFDTFSTSNHMLLCESTTPPEVFENYGVILNKNFIPCKEKGFKIGIRIGLQAITTRGFTSDEIKLLCVYMIEIANLYTVFKKPYCKVLHKKIQQLVKGKKLFNTICKHVVS